MAQTTRIAVLGFTPFERVTFEAFFRLASRRVPAYDGEADPRHADFVLVDADDAALVAQVQREGLVARCVMLGATTLAGAALQVPRPVNLMLVMRALDSLPRKPGDAGTAPAPTAAVAAAAPRRDFAATQPVPFIDAAPVSPPPPSAAPILLPMPLFPEPQAAADDPGLDHILVVDDSDVALRFMAGHLGRFGFHVHLARSGAEALERISRRHFEIVFLDVTMEGMDGFKTCKAIKRASYPDQRQPPAVVMLTSRSTPVDKMRGTMAGCDAYLTKPLQEVELLALVGDREIQRHNYASTMNAGHSML